MIPTRPSRVRKLRDELQEAQDKFSAEESTLSKKEHEHEIEMRTHERDMEEKSVAAWKQEAVILRQEWNSEMDKLADEWTAEWNREMDKLDDEWTAVCMHWQQTARSAVGQTEELHQELTSERLQWQADRDAAMHRAQSETQGLTLELERLRRELEATAASNQILQGRLSCESDTAQAMSSKADALREQAAALRSDHTYALQELHEARTELRDLKSLQDARLRSEGEELALARAESSQARYEFRLELAQSRDPDSELASKSKIKLLKNELAEAKWFRDKALDDRKRAVDERDHARKAVRAVEANQCRDIAELHARIARQQQQIQDAQREFREVLDKSRRFQAFGADIPRLDRVALNSALEPVRGWPPR